MSRQPPASAAEPQTSTGRGPTDSIADAADDAVDAVQDGVTRVADHPVVEAGARLGYVANAAMHLGIAALAIRLALGYRRDHADQSGAMGLIDDHRWGVALLLAAIAGWALLALWQLGEAALPWAKPTERVKAVSKAVVYAGLAWTTRAFAEHRGTDSGGQATGIARDLVDTSWGRGLVMTAGLVVVGVGLYHVLKGARRRFLADLREDPGDVAVLAGIVGYGAKGIALVIAGVLVVQAGAQARPGKASGLDGAFRTVLEAPYGALLVAVIGVGFAAYAVYSLARARYARV